MHVIQLRDHWAAADDEGARTFTRSFGAPRLPDPSAALWLVGESDASLECVINGETLPVTWNDGQFEINVTGKLQPRNRIALRGPVGVSLRNVVLQIRDGMV